MRRMLTAGAIVIALFLPLHTYADLPRPAGFVNDFANVMQPGARAQLESLISSIERASGIEIAVVTVGSLDGRPIEDYAVDLYKTWGISKKGTDEGVLILVAPTDKRVRIEVGYGLEGALNDAMAGRIIRELMIPAFKEGDFTRGIAMGTQAVAAIALKEKGIDPASLGAAPNATLGSTHEGGPLSTIFKIIALIVMIYLFIRHPWLFIMLLASTGRGGGGRGGFGGGFGGFGGGLSGGGGASGRW